MNDQRKHRNIIGLLLAFLLFANQCDQPVASFSYVDEPESKRQSQLVIDVVDALGNPLDEFDLLVDAAAPVKQSVVGNRLVVEQIPAGIVSLGIGKQGYVSQRVSIPITYPDGVFSEIHVKRTIRLVSVEPTRMVNPTSASPFLGGYTQKPGYNQIPTELTLLPGSLPGGAAVELSITRIPVINESGVISTIGTMTIIDVLGLNLSGINLLHEATWKIPLQLNAPIKNLRPNFWLIPVAWSADTGGFTPDGDPISGVTDQNLDFVTFNITALRSYAVASDLGLRLITQESAPVQLSRSSCGVKLEAIHHYESESAIPGILFMNPFLPSSSQKQTVRRQFSGVDRHRIVIEASNVVQTWQLLHPVSRLVVQESSINTDHVRFFVHQQRCLDSGGS